MLEATNDQQLRAPGPLDHMTDAMTDAMTFVYDLTCPVFNYEVTRILTQRKRAKVMRWRLATTALCTTLIRVLPPG